MRLINPRLCRAGRSLLDWSRGDLAKEAGVAERTLVDYERGARDPHETTEQKMQSALEDGGVVFIAVGDIRGVGVREP